MNETVVFFLHLAGAAICFRFEHDYTKSAPWFGALLSLTGVVEAVQVGTAVAKWLE